MSLAARVTGRLLLEVWFDPICPWAYLGERRLTAAVDRAGITDQVDVVWRSFELDPDATSEPTRTGTQVMLDAGADPTALAARWEQIHRLAAAEGVSIDMEASRPVSTHDAHRTVHLARTAGVERALVRRLFHAHHGELRNIAAHDVLQDLAVEVGLAAPEVQATLAGRRFSAEIRAEQARAARLGVRDVPTALLDERTTVPLFRPVADLAGELTAAIGHAVVEHEASLAATGPIPSDDPMDRRPPSRHHPERRRPSGSRDSGFVVTQVETGRREGG